MNNEQAEAFYGAESGRRSSRRLGHALRTNLCPSAAQVDALATASPRFFLPAPDGVSYVDVSSAPGHVSITYCRDAEVTPRLSARSNRAQVRSG